MGEGAPAVDVSVEGTLVWLRRPNGSWWPSIVISPQDVPEGCPPPPRCPATPIMLLGRRPDGPTYVDWCNLDRCKRVKPFRCGDLDFEQRITNALTLAATTNRSTWSYNKGRYARMEDAILQALDIEKETALGTATKSYLHAATGSCSPTPKIEMPNGQVKDAVAAKDAAPAIQPSPPLPLPPPSPVPPPPPPPKRKRKTPYDSEDDVPKGSRRMRDLRDIGPKTAAPMDSSNAAAPMSAPKYDDLLPNHGQVNRTVHSQATTKRKHAADAHQDQPCGMPRKKDRSRPLAELCNGDMWNGSRPNGHKAGEHLLGVATCSSSSSGTSTLDTPLDTNSCHRSITFKIDHAKGTELSCMTRLLSEDSQHGNGFVETPPAAQNIVEPDHLRRYQPCGLTKNHTWKPNKQTNDARRAERRARKNVKMRTISSVDQEGKNRASDFTDHGHHKTKTGKHKAVRDEVVLLEKRLEKRTLNKVAEHDTKMHNAVVPSGMDCGAVQQQRCKIKCDPEESLENLSGHSNCESGSVSSLVFEKPLQVLPPEEKPLGHERCHAVKPIKHLNPSLYDVELSVLGSSNAGRRVPLVSLMSRWNRKHVVGYPISVEVSDDVFDRPLLRKDVQQPATSSVNGIVLKKDETQGLQRVVPSSAQTCRSKPKSHSRRPSEKEVDKLWQPHTKKAASSSRKMRRLSSFASGQRDGDDRKSAVGKVAGATIACIPLRVVFSRINEALSFAVNENALPGCGAASRLMRR